eukprot:4979499-Pyramimonas_sp.AAC.1
MRISWAPEPVMGKSRDRLRSPWSAPMAPWPMQPSRATRSQASPNGHIHKANYLDMFAPRTRYTTLPRQRLGAGHDTMRSQDPKLLLDSLYTHAHV